MGKNKPKITSVSLAGCFGCHMSLLDLDERLLTLLEQVEFVRSPINDIKTITHADIGIIEGGVANTENVEVLRDFRAHCTTLIAFGACAITGGIPAMRNNFEVEDCLTSAYIDGKGVVNPHIPDDPELPLMLNQVHPVHEIVEVDYYLPGCPPSADTIWTFLNALLAGEAVDLPYQQIRYD